MAASQLSKPGTMYGPCIGECNHADCVGTRKMAEFICKHCGKAIGYDDRFYNIGEQNQSDYELVHLVCEHEAMEKESV